MDSFEFKIIIVGDAKVGKTTFVTRCLTGDFETEYVATLGCNVNFIDFNTNYGKVRFNLWDLAGKEKFSFFKNEYHLKSDGVVMMFDTTNPFSYVNLKKHYENIRKTIGCEKIPIVLCGNKVDIRNRKVLPQQIKFHRENDILSYFDISAKSNYNFEKPFLVLARKLTGKEDLHFTGEITYPPHNLEDLYPSSIIDINLIPYTYIENE